MDRKKKEKKSRGRKMLPNDKTILRYLGMNTDVAAMIKELQEPLKRQLVEDHQSEIPGQYKDKFKDIIIFHNKDDKQKAEEFKSFVESQVEGVRIFMYGDNITQVDTIDNHFPTICFKFRENTGRKGKRIVKVMSAFIFLTKQFFERDWNELSTNGPFKGMLYDENSLVVPVLPVKKEELGFRIPMGLNQLRPLNHFLQDDELYQESLKTQVLEKIRMRKKMEEQQFRDQVSWLIENVLEKQRQKFWGSSDESCSSSPSDDDESYKTKRKSPPQGSPPSSQSEKDSGFGSFSYDQLRNGHNSSHQYTSDQFAYSSHPSSQMIDPGNRPYYGHSNSLDFQSMNFSRDSQMHSLPNQYPQHQLHAGFRNGHHGQGIHRHPDQPYSAQGHHPNADRYYPQQQRFPERMDSYQTGGYGSLRSNSMPSEHGYDSSLRENVEPRGRNVSGIPTQVPVNLGNISQFQGGPNMNPQYYQRSMQSNGEPHHQGPVPISLTSFPPHQYPGHRAPNSIPTNEGYTSSYDCTPCNSDTSSQSSMNFSSTSTDGLISGSSDQASLISRGLDDDRSDKKPRHRKKVIYINNAKCVQIGSNPTIVTTSAASTINGHSDSHQALISGNCATDTSSSSLSQDGPTGTFDIQSANIPPVSSTSHSERPARARVQGTTSTGQNTVSPIPPYSVHATKQNVPNPHQKIQQVETDTSNRQGQNIQTRNVGRVNHQQHQDQGRPKSDEELRYQLNINEFVPSESFSSQTTGNFSINSDNQGHFTQQRKQRPVAMVSPMSANKFSRDCRIDNTGSSNRSGSNPHDRQPGSSDEDETDMKKFVREGRDDETEVKEVIDADSEETELKK